MDKRWTSHLSKTPDKQQEFKSIVIGSSLALERLRDILKRDLDISYREQRKVDHYETPNWELRQVDCNATQRTLQTIINLLEI